MDINFITSITGMLSGLGACCSAIATFLTVREMKKQREASYLPYIDYSIPIFNSDNKNSNLKIYNIGLGVAKNINLSIDMPLERFLPTLNSELLLYRTNIAIENNYLKFLKRQDDNSTIIDSFSIPCTMHCNFLFPGKENSVNINLPDYFHILFDIINDMAFNNNNNVCKSILKNISFTISMTFSDVGNKLYKENHICNVFDVTYDHAEKKYNMRFI